MCGTHCACIQLVGIYSIYQECPICHVGVATGVLDDPRVVPVALRCIIVELFYVAELWILAHGKIITHTIYIYIYIYIGILHIIIL